ncbi:MAG: hypothetical protein PQJ45_08445 [Sphaerochaetaceae bacterium]|nr:hypothetical protein [Sphaerochaetaceae bacterium]
MKKIRRLILEVQKAGMPQYIKQTLDISDEGYVKQSMSPMVYLGQMKVYDYSVDKKDIEEFFSGLDFSKWRISKQPSSTNFSFSCKILYVDGQLENITGYIHPQMPEEYQEFDNKILEMIPFIENPWLFTT